MQKAVYEDYKYAIQDTNRIYVGSKYTFREILDEEELLFKFRLVTERYILQEADPDDTLETHLYYLEPGSFLVKLYKQMKGRVRVNVIEEKKSLFRPGSKEGDPGRGKLSGGGKRQYVTKQLTIEQLTAIPPAEKERQGMVIQELSVSKLALIGM